MCTTCGCGAGKPLKYPHMFAAVDLVWMPLSVRTGDNLDAWLRDL